MCKKLVIGFAVAVFLLIPTKSSAEPRYTFQEGFEKFDIADFKPSLGDYFIVDLEEGQGYLVNDFAETYTSFPVITGQRKVVRYIGRTYFAATPEKTWHVKEKEIKRDRITFSESGEFFRLYDDGKNTPYGVHGYRYFDELLAKTKFGSMGCILVADNVLDVIEQSVAANNNDFTVITTNGSQENSN